MAISELASASAVVPEVTWMTDVFPLLLLHSTITTGQDAVISTFLPSHHSMHVETLYREGPGDRKRSATDTHVDLIPRTKSSLGCGQVVFLSRSHECRVRTIKLSKPHPQTPNRRQLGELRITGHYPSQHHATVLCPNPILPRS